MSQAAVTERKLAFVRRQKQILNKPIPPSNKLYQIAEHGGIQDKVLRDVMLKVNRDLKRHGREVYSSQMTDHVVEQIDILYWEAGGPSLESEADAAADPIDEDPAALYQGEDLTLDSSISKLPSTWETTADSSTAPQDDPASVDQDDYMEAASRIQNLSAQRLILQQKLNTYRTLLSLLEPYRTPQESIQPHLITRGTPLVPELSKTRTLAIRAAGRIDEKFGNAHSSATSSDPGTQKAEADGKTKLNNILAKW